MHSALTVPDELGEIAPRLSFGSTPLNPGGPGLPWKPRGPVGPLVPRSPRIPCLPLIVLFAVAERSTGRIVPFLMSFDVISTRVAAAPDVIERTATIASRMKTRRLIASSIGPGLQHR